MIAEFWNTTSNIYIILPCLHGFAECRRLRLPWRYVLAYASLMLVGIGSWLFHMTLLWEYQVSVCIRFSCIFLLLFLGLSVCCLLNRSNNHLPLRSCWTSCP